MESTGAIKADGRALSLLRAGGIGSGINLGPVLFCQSEKRPVFADGKIGQRLMKAGGDGSPGDMLRPKRQGHGGNQKSGQEQNGIGRPTTG